MYKVIVDNQTQKFTDFEKFINFIFALKCSQAEFKVIYPSDYEATFKPLSKCHCEKFHNSIEISSNRCNDCELKLN